METTSRRLASTMCCLAATSPRSMRLARYTSSAAVSSGTRPIARRYRRSESKLGSIEPSSCSRLASSAPAWVGA